MSDECVAHVLRERENSIVVGLGTSHSEAAVLPINVAWDQVGHFLHAESEAQTQKQESQVATVAPLPSPAGGKKRMNLLVGEIFWQAGLAVARDFWQGSPNPEEFARTLPDTAKHCAEPSTNLCVSRLVSRANSSLHIVQRTTFSFGNALLALEQCTLRNLQPGPLNTYNG
jgi:hypothetical protein